MHKNKLSLTFNQTTQSLSKPYSVSNVNPSTFSFGVQAVNTFGTMDITNAFNNQFHDIYSNLNNIRQNYQQRVNELIASGSSSNDTLRNKGVELAWKYEQAELEMGGSGTRNWTPDQQKEIFEKGRARNFEGHHKNSVGTNPSQQANPDNIEFLEEHRKGDGVREHFDKHGRSWNNQTEGDLIDRNGRLKRINRNRVIKNELVGIGTAAAIGLGVGFTLGFVITLAQSGISTENLKNATRVGRKAGAEGAVLGVVNHLVVRGVGEVATNALQGVVKNLGFTVTENITKMCNMAVMGGLAIVIFSVYQFTKLKLQGYSTKECIIRVGKSVAFSATVLLASIIAQGLWGGHAGIIVSISIGIIVISYKIIESQHNKRISEKVRLYMIEKCEPVLEG
ncbi:MAG: hypothetical protein ACOCRO_10775 [Halanaerobiales bacterium]